MNNTHYTAEEVRLLSNRIPRSHDEIADMQEALRAFAARLEADERAEPVAWMYEHDGVVDAPMLTPKRIDGADKEPWTETRLYTRPAPASSERLAEALRQIAVTTKGYPNASREGEIAIKALAAHDAKAQPPAAS